MKIFTGSINRRIVSILAPIIIITFVVLSFISYYSSKNAIEAEISRSIEFQVQQSVKSIEINLSDHAKLVEALSKTVGESGKLIKPESYKSILQKTVALNNDTFGMGVWYEPYKYTSGMKFYGPYVYRDKGNYVLTMDYSNEKYNYPAQDWYIIGKNTKSQIGWTAPYYDDTTKVTMITAVSPFFDENNQFQGVISGDIDLNVVIKRTSSIKIGTSGYAFLLGNDGTYISNNNKAKIMKANIKSDAGIKEIASQVLNATEEIKTASFIQNGEKYRVYYRRIPETGWIIGMTIAEKDLFSSATALIYKLIPVIIIGIILTLLAIFFTSRYISALVKKVNVLTQTMSEGDFSSRIDAVSSDEIGIMINNLNHMSEEFRNIIKTINEDLDGIVASSEELTAISDQTQIAAEQVGTTAHDIAAGMKEQVDEAETSSTTIRDMTKQMEDMTENIAVIAGTAEEASKHAARGNADAVKAVEQMNNINHKIHASSEAIDSLKDKSKEIGEIVVLITSITSQTNLLALNASIEAARAGEVGKGFAVVAEEVRKLAEQSQDATSNIEVLVNEIQKDIETTVKSMKEGLAAIEEGSEMVGKAGTSFGTINSDVGNVSMQLTRIRKSIQDMNSRTQDVVSAYERVLSISRRAADDTFNLSAASEEQIAFMKEVSNAAEALTELAVDLNGSVKKYKI